MALGRKVHELPAADAVHPRRPGEDLRASGAGLNRQRRAQYGSEGLRLQRIPRQHGRALAKHLVVGGLAAAQVVVVHARQVVVYQRIGVQHLHRAGHGQGLFRLQAVQAREFQHQHRAYALAAGRQAVVHGIQQPVELKAAPRAEIFLQRRLDDSQI